MQYRSRCNILTHSGMLCFVGIFVNKGNNKITELQTILQRESQNS
jgi:hypothetical protein